MVRKLYICAIFVILWFFVINNHKSGGGCPLSWESHYVVFTPNPSCVVVYSVSNANIRRLIKPTVSRFSPYSTRYKHTIIWPQDTTTLTGWLMSNILWHYCVSNKTMIATKQPSIAWHLWNLCQCKCRQAIVHNLALLLIKYNSMVIVYITTFLKLDTKMVVLCKVKKLIVYYIVLLLGLILL